MQDTENRSIFRESLCIYAVKSSKVLSYPGEESAYQARENEQKEAKNIIANKALSYIEIGRSTFLDSGSTIMSLTNIIPDNYYSIITSGVNIALKLLDKAKPSIVVLGGFANRNAFSTSGPLASSFLDILNIDVAFISASGFSLDNHFTVSNIYEAELKTKVLMKAKKVVVLMDNSKINKVLPYTFAKLSDIGILITEAALPNELKSAIESSGVCIV